MNDLAKSERKGILLVGLSMILVSIHTIYFYNVSVPVVETKKLIQQIIRFLLTGLILFFVFQGKRWAKNTLSVLLIIGLLMSLKIFTIEIPLINKVPTFVMIFVYSFGLYYLNISREFKEFYLFQNGLGGTIITIPTYSNNSGFSLTILNSTDEELNVLISNNDHSEKITLSNIDPEGLNSLSEMDPKQEDRPVSIYKADNCELIIPLEELDFEDDYIGFNSDNENWAIHSGILTRVN